MEFQINDTRTPEQIAAGERISRMLEKAVLDTAASYIGLTEQLIKTALLLGYRLDEMDMTEEHRTLIPECSRRTVLFVTRDGAREKFGEVTCMFEGLKVRLRLHVETEKKDA